MAERVTVRVVPRDEFPAEVVAHLRWRVLQQPFGVAQDEDWNDDAPGVSHIVAHGEGGTVIGYARVEVEGDSARVKQVVVDFHKQGTGLGRLLMGAAIERARELGLRDVVLDARQPAWGFYERLGFVSESEPVPYGRTSLPHRRMRLQLR